MNESTFIFISIFEMLAALILLSFSLSFTDAFLKFVYLEVIQKNVDFCSKKNQISGDLLTEILHQSTVFSEPNDVKQLCFLQCLYQVSDFIDVFGSVKQKFIDTVIQKVIGHDVDVEFSTEIFASNIILMCKTKMKHSCLKSVRMVECLEAVCTAICHSEIFENVVLNEYFLQIVRHIMISKTKNIIIVKKHQRLPSEKIRCDGKIFVYLHVYGYLNSKKIKKRRLVSKELGTILRKTVTEFQVFFGLSVTGSLNSDTLNIIYQSRCGIPDIIRSGHQRQKRYILYKYKWETKNLAYKITKYSKNLSEELINKEISRAFKTWTSVIPLTIRQKKYAEADITIRFATGVHGDENPFDGPGAVLAHTYYPNVYSFEKQKSFIHFDDAEKWTAFSKKGVNLFQVALHEIGHSLGLKHSNVQDSVMWPMHRDYSVNYTLHLDDIQGVQAMYGSKNKRK